MHRLDTAYYPPLEPYRSGHLEVGQGHRLYFEECGNAQGRPAVFVHGGPGGAIKPYFRQAFDPATTRIILYDQRGCGRSTPTSALAHNSTPHLVADLEMLREHLGIARWVVTGGSWGSTLALAYAQSHADVVAGLLISGVFLARREDLDWWWHGVRPVMPEVWDAMIRFLPESERATPRESYLARVLSDDPEVSKAAAIAMMIYESQTLDVLPDREVIDAMVDSDQVATMGRIFAHYDSHGFFLEEGQLLRNAHRLTGVPGSIINGRHDMCTPAAGAWDLAQVWPEATLDIVGGAGHRLNDEVLGRVFVGRLRELMLRARW